MRIRSTQTWVNMDYIIIFVASIDVSSPAKVFPPGEYVYGCTTPSYTMGWRLTLRGVFLHQTNEGARHMGALLCLTKGGAFHMSALLRLAYEGASDV